MSEGIASFLMYKISEYKSLASPLERATREIELSHQLLRARVETEIVDEVPALGALTEVLNVSVIDLLLASDRVEFVNQAMQNAGLTVEDVLQQLRALGAPPQTDELTAIGLAR